MEVAGRQPLVLLVASREALRSRPRIGARSDGVSEYWAQLELHPPDAGLEMLPERSEAIVLEKAAERRNSDVIPSIPASSETSLSS
jgi:hypothetical protein